MKKLTTLLAATICTFMVISCASKDSAEDYDYEYDYTQDEYGYINYTEPVSTEDFLAN